MTNVLRGIGVSAALVIASFMSGEAGAMPVGGPGKAALERIGVIAQAQYSYGGNDYCWYDDGWNGPGWYVCGQYTVRGVGWGGASGWHGWTHTSGTVVRGGTVSGRTGGGRTGSVSGRTGGGRTGSASGRTGGGRTGTSGRTGGGRTGASGRTGGGRTGGHASGRGGGGRTGGGRGGGGRRSDILLKHDVALIGRLENGLGFYRFSYNGSEKAYVGVIAQEVERAVPEAVMRGSDGYLRVRYDMLGMKFQTYEQWLAAGATVPSGPPLRH
jgi:hypothetical protein